MRVTDRQIREAIASLLKEEGSASGARVRSELARRHGARGGVARIYRILAEAGGAARLGETGRLAARVAELEAALAQMQARAELAEHREIAHQDWAATQIHQLRSRLQEYERSPPLQGVRHEVYLEVHRKLADARARIAELEAQPMRRDVELDAR